MAEPDFPEYLEIDGSAMEGGGQILRVSISLSAVLGIPVRVINIRAGRSKPGLASQHLKGIQLVASMCQARVYGDRLRSTEVEFRPGRLKGGNYCVDTKTAGSVSLLLQVALPCALFADGPVTLDLRGGTNADMAPPIDYMTEVFKPILNKFGGDFELTIHKRGYYPKGGGRVTINITPVRRLRSISAKETGAIQRIYGWSFVAGTLPLKLAYEMADGAKQVFQNDHQVSIECYKEDKQMGSENCSGIILVAETQNGFRLGSDALGRKDSNALEVGMQAGQALKADLDSKSCFDTHGQDQVILLMALADGASIMKTNNITLHTKTAMYITMMMTKVKFEEIQVNDTQNIIECDGLGFRNKYLNVFKS